MNNLNPIYFIEGNLEAGVAGGAMLLSTGIPQQIAKNMVNRIRARRAQTQQQAQEGEEQQMTESFGSDDEDAYGERPVSPYIKMMRKNRRIIHQNAFPYDNS